ETAAVKTVAASEQSPQVELSSREVALQSANGLIAGTFDMLVDVEESDGAAPSDAEVAVVAAVESVAVEAGGGEAESVPELALAKRSVTSVPIGTDGQPVWPLSSSAGPPIASAASAAAEEAAIGQNAVKAQRQ